MEKAPDAFRTISEVAVELDVPQHVLRFWESRFREIKPMKRGGGRRYYRPDDVVAAARHPPSALRRGLHHPRRAAHPPRAGRQIRAGGRAPGRAGETGRTRRTDRGGRRARFVAAASEAERSRGLFALLPALLGDRNEPPEPEFSIEDLRPEPPAPPSQRLVPPVPGSSGIPREDLRRLQAALHEMAECRRLLDVALRESA